MIPKLYLFVLLAGVVVDGAPIQEDSSAEVSLSHHGVLYNKKLYKFTEKN